jgi:hypothetical protein
MTAELQIETTYNYFGWCKECSDILPTVRDMESHEEFSRLYGERLKELRTDTDDRDDAVARVTEHNEQFHAGQLVGPPSEAGATEEEGAGMAKDKEVLFTVRALDSRDVYIERGLDGELLKVRVSAPPSLEGEVGR